MPISPLSKQIIAITAGDPAGIGPELILRSLSSIKTKDEKFLIIGDKSVFDKAQKKLRKKMGNLCSYSVVHGKNLTGPKAKISLLDLNIVGGKKYVLGRASRLCAQAQAQYLLEAAKLLREKKARALVTAPINKAAVNLAGYKWQGQTEVLARLTKTKNFAMAFVAGQFRITLITTHVPLRRVSRALKTNDISGKIELTDNFLKKYFKIKKPRLGVCGLNPHASDSGLFGSEEREIILPAVNAARRKKINVLGPVSAEKLFYDAYRGKFDALVAMYHDQALIALKMLLRDEAVNLTLGLPYIRTSCSSGTAYDIADKFIAKEATMIAAIKLAVKLSASETEA